MPHHVLVRLPDGRTAWADWREPIVATMRDIHAQVANAANPDDVRAVTVWLDGHEYQSQLCAAGKCDHD